MTTALERIAAFLVEPAAPPKPTAALPTACRVAVLGSIADTPPLAAALALTLRAAERRPAAVVALWGAPAPPAAPALRAAKKLAAAVSPPAARGAVARGRLVWLALPDDPVAAVDAVVAAAGVTDAPLVTALAGARPSGLDDLVAGHDLVVVAASPGSSLARAAVERLGRRGLRATACRPLGRGVVRALAMAGVTTSRLELSAGHEEPR